MWLSEREEWWLFLTIFSGHTWQTKQQSIPNLPYQSAREGGNCMSSDFPLLSSVLFIPFLTWSCMIVMIFIIIILGCGCSFLRFLFLIKVMKRVNSIFNLLFPCCLLSLKRFQMIFLDHHSTLAGHPEGNWWMLANMFLNSINMWNWQVQVLWWMLFMVCLQYCEWSNQK